MAINKNNEYIGKKKWFETGTPNHLSAPHIDAGTDRNVLLYYDALVILLQGAVS